MRSVPAVLLAFATLTIFLVQQPGAPSYGNAPAQIQVAGDVATPLKLSASDLKKLPRKTVKVFNPHEKKDETYEGVGVQELLRQAGVPQHERLRGAGMAMYVLAQASDGYRVVYAIAELDSDFQDSEVIVADTMNGSPLAEEQGPFKMVAPHDKRPARWIRMLKSLTVVSAAPSSKP